MEIEEIIKAYKQGNIFITGGAGVGKSWTVTKLNEELPLVLTASTGMAAINIGGQTIHSWAGVAICEKPIDAVVGFITKTKMGKTKYHEILNCEYLVIDEISMLNAYTFDYISKVLSEVRGIDKPFGGIHVAAIGDLYQLPPVKLGEKVEINKAERLVDYCFNSDTWKKMNFKTINLTKVYRQNDEKFITALNHVRVGEITKEDKKLFESRNFPYSFQPPQEAVKIYAVNEQVDAENQKRFNEINEKAYTFKATNQIKCWADGYMQWLSPTSNKVPPLDKKKYENFDRDCRIPDVLTLKKGCRVMLLINKDFDRGLVNGSCGYVTELNQHKIVVKFDNGEEEQISMETTELKDGKKAKITRDQYPLRLAWSSSVHKVQGSTFDSCFVDCSRFFETGQAYVALSRARTLDKLYLKNFDADKILVDNKVKEFYDTVIKNEK